MPLLLPAPPGGHDRGIAHDPTGLAKVFAQHPDHHFIGLDEYIGYQSAVITNSPVENGMRGDYLRSALSCAALEKLDIGLHLSDWLHEKLYGRGMWVDGKQAEAARTEWTTISLAAGSDTLPSNCGDLFTNGITPEAVHGRSK